MAEHRHIHLRNLGTASETFSSRGFGSRAEISPVPDRRVHAARLRDALETTLRDLDAMRREQALNGVKREHRGMTLRVESRAGEPLLVGDKRSDTRGLKLLNVRRSKAEGARWSDKAPEGDVAAYFVTRESAKSLRKALDGYSQWVDDAPFGSNLPEDEVERRPSNFWLFESAASFGPARVEDLWTDAIPRFPKYDEDVPWEVWTRRGYEWSFAKAVERLGIAVEGHPTHFVSTDVNNVVATAQQIEALIRQSAAVVELRGASTFRATYLDDISSAGTHDVDALVRRVTPAPADATRITALDTGVSRHPLLRSSLPQSRCRTVEPSWPRNDHDGHGTKIAGLALLGDLRPLIASAATVQLETSLESVVVSAPGGHRGVPARDALARAVTMVEAEPHSRIYCLAATAVGEVETGRPTSTSAVLDALAFNDGEHTRLFCVAVGNVETSVASPYRTSHYRDRNQAHGVQSPAQALNALSVGAASLMAPGGMALLAPSGDLSPTSRTAQSWVPPHPYKPDIVLEGGNHVSGPHLGTSSPSADHLPLTTSMEHPHRSFAVAGETSAATAAAARLSAKLLTRYPTFRKETVKAMMIHSARWTPSMLARRASLVAAGATEAEAWASVFACYGWGVPDETRLFRSASDDLTLVVEDEIRPYAFGENRVKLREMKYFRLPWPSATLSSMGRAEVEMRCTLCYFVEPEPHAAARDRFDKYASHRLRFDVRRFDETHDAAQRRVNLSLGGDELFDPPVQDEGWLIGNRLPRRGGLMQDVWSGPAYKLAERDGISVIPTKGWWADRTNLDRHERTVRFSLVVSVSTPETGVDLHAETFAMAQANAAKALAEASVDDG